MVNAIAPPAPIGASFISAFIMAKKMWEQPSMNCVHGCTFSAHVRHGVAEQHRHEQHLQQFAGAGERVEERRRNDAQNEVSRGLRRGALGVVCDGAGIESRRVDVEASTRAECVDDDEADDERDRRDHFEVEQRLAAHTADLLHVARAGDAEHDRAEDDRADQHLDERDEPVAERLEPDAGGRIGVADRTARENREQDPEIEMPSEAFHARLPV